jgi:hypothetical protein
VWEHEKIAVEQFLYKTTTRKGENISFYETEGLPPTGYIRKRNTKGTKR